MLVAALVVAHSGPVHGSGEQLGGDGRRVCGVGPGSGLLQIGEDAAGVPTRELQQIGPSILGQGVTAPVGGAQAALVIQGSVDEAGDVLGAQGFQGEQQGSAEQRRDDRERRVLGGGGDEGDDAVLHCWQQDVLLGLGEPVHLVDEEHGGPPVDEFPARNVQLTAHVLDASRHRGDLDEPAIGGVRDHRGDRRLADPGWPPQEDTHRGRSLGQTTQWGAGGEQVLLTDDLVHRAGTQPHCQRGIGIDGVQRPSRGGGGRLVARIRVSEEVGAHSSWSWVVDSAGGCWPVVGTLPATGTRPPSPGWRADAPSQLSTVVWGLVRVRRSCS